MAAFGNLMSLSLLKEVSGSYFRLVLEANLDGAREWNGMT